jgi:hypothetical protein
LVFAEAEARHSLRDSKLWPRSWVRL